MRPLPFSASPPYARCTSQVLLFLAGWAKRRLVSPPFPSEICYFLNPFFRCVLFFFTLLEAVFRNVSAAPRFLSFLILTRSQIRIASFFPLLEPAVPNSSSSFTFPHHLVRSDRSGDRPFFFFPKNRQMSSPFRAVFFSFLFRTATCGFVNFHSTIRN